MLELAIVGAGVMGSHHGRVAMGLRDARPAFIVDPDAEAGSRLAESTGAKYVPDVSEVIGRIQAAIVAVPTHLHRSISEQLLSEGIHVLLEKPIASSVDEALSVVETAERNGVRLMIGHVERFNPAILELDRIVSDPVHIDVARIGPHSPRLADHVVLDLMVHDLDIATALVGSPVHEIAAFGRGILGDEPDIASAMLRFEGGATAVFTASRIGQSKIRRLEITQHDSFVVVDMLRQTVMIERGSQSEFLDEERAYRQEGVIEIPYLSWKGEPLYLEQEHFVGSVLSGTEPKVDGRAGVQALQLSLEVTAAVEQSSAGRSA
ncbi:MAG: Gfo/Idh/MocA family protein [Acidimicrobiia bacterium]